MLAAGAESPQFFFALAAVLLPSALAGCSGNPLGLGVASGPLELVKVTDLQPGSYCEIEMVVPPLAPEGSLHCFNGTVQEVNRDEVVLVKVLEQCNVDYGLNSRRRPLTQQKRDLVHVPLLGVHEIWALPPGKGSPVAKPSASPPAGHPS